MTLDSGNRSFLWLLAVGVALYLALAAAACVLLSLLFFRLASDGLAAFGDTAWVLAPATAFLGLIGASGVLGIRSLGAQLAASRRLARRIEAVSGVPPRGLVVAGASAGLDDRLRLIESAESFSFTYGVLHPRVVVSRPLLESTTRDELAAVLTHERYHVRNFDPCKVVLARVVASAFFFLPALGQLEGRYLIGRELAADRRAVNICGRRSLAGALLKVVRGPAWPELGMAAAIGGPELLGVRIAQLEARGELSAGRLTHRALLATAAAIAILALSFFGALAGLGDLTSAMSLSGPQMEASGVEVVMAMTCAMPFLAVGWLVWRWFTA